MEETKDMKKIEEILADKFDKTVDESLESSDTEKIDQSDVDTVAGGARAPIFDDSAIELPEI